MPSHQAHLGILKRFCKDDQLEEAREAAKQLKHIFGEGHVYISLQPFQQDESLAGKLRDVSQSTDIPLVATGDVHYINREDKMAYTCLKAIKAGSGFQR